MLAENASPTNANPTPHWMRSSGPQPFWDTVRNKNMGRYLFQHEYAFIRRWLDAVRQPHRLLDIACGSGWLSVPLHNAGLNVVGLDLNPLALALFQQRTSEIPLFRGDALRLPFADKSFDCVIAIECFEYFPDYCGFLQGINRVLVDGGLLIFDTLNRHSYKWQLKMLLGRALSYPSPNLSSNEVLRVTADQGFNIQGVSGYNWVPFTRDSNSPLLPVAALIEQKLRLDRYYSISPKILVAATKEDSRRDQGIPWDGRTLRGTSWGDDDHRRLSDHHSLSGSSILVGQGAGERGV